MILLASACFLGFMSAAWFARRSQYHVSHFWWAFLSCLFALVMALAIIAAVDGA